MSAPPRLAPAGGRPQLRSWSAEDMAKQEGGLPGVAVRPLAFTATAHSASQVAAWPHAAAGRRRDLLVRALGKKKAGERGESLVPLRALLVHRSRWR